MSEETELAEVVQEILDHRNAFAHHRGPHTAPGIDEAGRALYDRVLALLRMCRFLRLYPLWYVLDSELPLGASNHLITYTRWMGRMPPSELGQVWVPRGLPRHSLYLKAANRFLPLTPWITRRLCPQCEREEIYFIEKADPVKRVLTFKSFDQGHTIETTEEWDFVAGVLGLS